MTDKKLQHKMNCMLALLYLLILNLFKFNTSNMKILLFSKNKMFVQHENLQKNIQQAKMSLQIQK